MVQSVVQDFKQFRSRASEFNSCENTIQLVIAFVPKEIVGGWKVRGACDK